MIIPIGTWRKGQYFPWATYCLIGANGIVYILCLVLGYEEALDKLAFQPDNFAWGQVLTHMFTHAGLFHLVGNMLFLWVFGPHVEDDLGPFNFLVLYLCAGLVAIGAQFGYEHWITQGEAARGGVGSSGAIAGILGLFAVRYYFVPVNVFVFVVWGWMYRYRIICQVYPVTGWLVLGLWFALQLLLAYMWGMAETELHTSIADVAYWAHIGGFAFGMAASFGLKMNTSALEENYFDQAREYAENGNWHGVKAAGKSLLRWAPTNPDANLMVADAMEQTHQAEDAAPYKLAAVEGLALAGRDEEASGLVEGLIAQASASRLDSMTVLKQARKLDAIEHDKVASRVFELFVALWPSDSMALQALLRAAELACKQEEPERTLRLLAWLIRLDTDGEWQSYAGRLRLVAEAKLQEEHRPLDLTDLK